MAVISKRRILILALLVASEPAVVRAQALPIQHIHLSIDRPVNANMPVWIKVDLRDPFEARYPYSEDPSDFGPNQLEVKRGGKILLPRPFPNSSRFVKVGIGDGSAAPASAPKNRLPLHLQYSIDAPGTYSVRWTAIRHYLAGDRSVTRVVARSDWFSFEVNPSTPEQRAAWLKKLLGVVPADRGKLVGDFLPSLLAAAPDPRVLQELLEQLYSPDPLASGFAFSSLTPFSPGALRTKALELVHCRGLSERMAYLIAWNPLFRDDKEDLVPTVLPLLLSIHDPQVAAALKLLGALAHGRNFNWPAKSKVPAQIDRAVVAIAPKLIKRSGDVPQILALYLGSVKGDVARSLLWQLADRDEPAHEQALIVLTWIGDERDLPRLGELLLKPGEPDANGRDLASLPYGLIRGYGDRAIPYLEKAISLSPYVFVRTSSAEQLALKGQPAAFSFFLDAVQNDRFYKLELEQWLKDYFGLPQNAGDNAVIAFLHSRLRH
jgi:hypothetical protein